MIRFAAFLIVGVLAFAAPASADPAFQQWLQSQWPEAQAARRLARDLRRGDARARARSVAARSRHSRPAGNSSRSSRNSCRRRRNICARRRFERLAARGQAARRAISRHARAHRAASSACPATSCWRSGRARPITAATSCRYDAIRVLATQAYIGKRKDFFRDEFLHALKMLQDGVPRADMRSSWGGAMGLTQFLPSEFYKYAVDFDGDGKRRHLAFGAGCARLGRQAARRQGLAARASRWAIEVRAPATSIAPSPSRAVRHADRRVAQARLSCRPMAASCSRRSLPIDASLLLPEGTYGPAFLTPKNYFVLKDYNFSDLYVLFVGHLSDRIARRAAVRDAVEQERAASRPATSRRCSAS